MKKLYFLVVLSFSFTSQAQIVNIPDANFKAKLLQSSYFNSIALDLNSNNLKIDINNDGEIQVSEALNVSEINIANSNINNLNGVLSFINIKKIYCALNNISSLDVSGLISLERLECQYNQMTFLNVSNLINLKYLECGNNNLTQLNLINLNNLTTLSASNNLLTLINSDNSLINLIDMSINFNQFSEFNFDNFNKLKFFSCYSNLLINVDMSKLTDLISYSLNNNSLETLIIKNGKNHNNSSSNFSQNYFLKYICVDDININLYQNKISSYGYSNCHINAYCSFTPGGTYYEIQGNSKIDSNSNGCDSNDINFPNLKFSITDGTNTGSLISNTSGNYYIPVQVGSHTITPVLENPTYYNINPTSFVANFPTQTTPLTQNFCVTPNGVHHDVEVTIIPTNPARPGFNAHYKIIYKNKGNQVENGTINFTFDDPLLDFVFANPSNTSQSEGILTWNYTNLQPLETRTINVVFNVNSPTETPAVNIGDLLVYTSQITPTENDVNPYDNFSGLKQTVVGSYDPNDKTCIEGTTVDPDMIGQYVHYVIRFENTGTYAAENIVVKDMIDLAKFDVNSLIPLHSSHDFVTRINGNKVEFIFEGINLPFDDANNDGYVAFKIKTKSNLVVGDTFSNNASIYFDYNFPIITNTFTTTIATLNTTDFDFGTHFTLYPNPVKDMLNFQSKDNVKINSIEIYNTLGQVVLAVPNATTTVDVSSLQSGSYFIKINTDLGVSNTKFVKE